MNSVEHKLELSLDPDLKNIKDQCSSSNFKMEAVDADEGGNILEGKPILNINEASGRNECFGNAVQGEIKSSEEGECKLNIKNETINDMEDEGGRYCQEHIKCEELIIKHEEDDRDEPDVVDICSECTVIVAIYDNPVLSGTVDRAAQTIPKGTLALRSSDAGDLGVYTLRHLKKGVQLGPYEGHVTKTELTIGHSWKLSGGRLVDGSDETSSNYFRYIKYAKDLSEQNLVAFQFKGELYYRTCRDIEKGEELLIYFNDNPGETYFAPVINISNEEFYKCQFCQLGLQFQAHRDRHQMFCKIQNNGSYVGSLCKHFASPKSEDEESKIKPVQSTTYDPCSYTKNQRSGLSTLDENFIYFSSVADRVDYFLQNAFSSLNYEQQLSVKKLGRPTPKMPSLILRDDKRNRSFNENNYTKNDWLTASIVRNKLYCWKCVLFISDENSVWGKIGFDDLQNLARGLERHNKSQEHISSYIKFEMLGKQKIVNFLDSTHKREIENFNEKVRENREILRKLIDATVYLVSKDNFFLGHHKTHSSYNKGNFLELIDLLKTYDPKLQTFLNEAGISKSIQNDLINSISSIIKGKIYDELHSCKFFSWQIDETMDITCKSQLSVIFRYVNCGEVVERFVGFFDVSSVKTADNLFRFLMDEFGQFDLKNKLIGQSYDGASVMSGHLYGLQAKIKNIAPQAYFTHCYAHKLNVVLSKACNGIKEVRIFFSNISGFSSFFSKSSKRSDILNSIMESRIPSNTPTHWNFSYRIIFIVYTYRNKLIDVFNFTSDYDDQTLRDAYGLKSLLLDKNFIYFLNVFNMIFEQTDVVFQILQNKLTDVEYFKTKLNSLIAKLKEFRTNKIHFDTLYKTFLESLEDFNEEPQLKSRKTTFNLNRTDLHYKQIFLQIVDTIIVQIETRFSDLNTMACFELINPNNFTVFSKSFPNNLMDKLIEHYPFFNRSFLRNELIALYTDRQILDQVKNAHELLFFIWKSNLRTYLPELYRFVSLVATVPVISPSVERSFSALERIKTYNRNTISQDSLSNISVILIEKRFLSELKKDVLFYDEVINHFANSENHRLPLIYKNI